MAHLTALFSNRNSSPNPGHKSRTTCAIFEAFSSIQWQTILSRISKHSGGLCLWRTWEHDSNSARLPKIAEVRFFPRMLAFSVVALTLGIFFVNRQPAQNQIIWTIPTSNKLAILGSFSTRLETERNKARNKVNNQYLERGQDFICSTVSTIVQILLIHR